MHTINLEQVKQVLKHVVLKPTPLKKRKTVMIIGQFGAGKTAAVEEFAEENGCFLHSVLLGQYDTVDLKGTPWVGDLGGGYNATVWHPASTLPFKGSPNFPTDRPIILFLDELTSATVPVLGICYQLTHKRRIGEFELMDNVYIVCAGNRESDRGIVNRMPQPLNNRMTWYELGLDLGVFCRWLQRDYGDEAAIFVAFLQFKKNLLCTWNPAKPEKVVATPRTIEMALDYYLDGTMPHDIKMASMAGSVGSGWNAEFWGFVEVWKQVRSMMTKIRKDPKNAPIPDEASMLYATAVSVSGELSKATAPALSLYLTRLNPMYLALAWQLATARDRSLYETDQFVEFSKKFKHMLDV